MIRFSIVVPCFDEAENLPLLLKRFSGALAGREAELIVVDNGSSDETPAVLERLLPQYPFARALRVGVNQGYGAGVVAGLRACAGEYLGWTHADLQTDPRDAVQAFDLVMRAREPRSTYAKGRRAGRPLLDASWTLGMSLFETLYMGVPLEDINAQPNVFHRSFFERWQDPPSDFSLDLYALYRARRSGLEVLRFPVVYGPRARGRSHWNRGLVSKCRFIRATLAASAAIKRRERPE